MGQESRRTGFFIGLAGFFGFSVIAGVLVAAMMTPAIALTSEAANVSIGVFDNLPETISLGRLTQQNAIYANRAGKPVQIATIYDQDRRNVSWDEVSPFLRNAAIAGEDRRFYDHGGVDVKSVVRAAAGNLQHKKVTSGASTIDMQLVRNILVQQALQIKDPVAEKKAYLSAIDDTMARKLAEMKLAIGLDKKYTKKQILLGYLNITGFGGDTYGVEAAARKYFSVDAKDVTLAQAASLIAIVEDPNNLNLGNKKNFADNKSRRDLILSNMLELNYVSQKQYDEAVATPITTKPEAPSNGCLYALDAKFACDYVTRLIPTLEALGASPSEREENWARGGYQVYTSIDLDQQDVAQAALSADAPADENRFALGAAADAVQPGTGRILVMAQNKEFNNSANGGGPTATAVNYSTDRHYGGSSGFPTGSTYKIFTLTDWLQKGHGLYDTVNGSVRSFPISSFTAACESLGGPPYKPKNDSPGEGGNMSVLQATVQSVNVAFIAMTQKLDLCDIRADAEAMGVHRADGDQLLALPSSTLGANEIAPLTMAGAIATIGANGVYCAPTIIDRIIDGKGHQLSGQPKHCTTAIEPNIASTVAFALAAVMKSGTGTAGNPHDGVPIVGKTGTTENAQQNWLIATTTKAALAVWVGNTDGGEQSLRRIRIAGTNGYNTKFNIFRTTMASLNKNPEYRGGDFPAPDPQFLKRSYRPPTPVTPPTAPVTPPQPPPAPPAGGNGNGKPGKP
ncbi:transglycosylase domain-containing protein [Parafrigoribacterium soli]|uniref:transglycosylase domain-containing protein n=1 Tax=Parafrigoribacterium soli TaxID=3144663 RepID=UPI0032ED188C